MVISILQHSEISLYFTYFLLSTALLLFLSTWKNITSLSSEKICIKFLHKKKGKLAVWRKYVYKNKSSSVQREKTQLTNFNLRFSLLSLLLLLFAVIACRKHISTFSLFPVQKTNNNDF